MDDLISRQAAIDAVRGMLKKQNGKTNILKTILQKIEDLPSLETTRPEAKRLTQYPIMDRFRQEFFHGDYDPTRVDERFGYKICSCCKKPPREGDNYCSNCGARMEDWKEAAIKEKLKQGERTDD